MKIASKLLVLLLAVTMIAGCLAACDGGKAPTDTTAEEATETDPADTGCGSAFTGVAVMISLLGLGVYALARKRKED